MEGQCGGKPAEGENRKVDREKSIFNEDFQ